MNAVILSESDSEELEHTSMYKQPIFIQPSDHITSHKKMVCYLLHAWMCYMTNRCAEL